MKPFKQYISEAVFNRILPAIRNKKDNKITTGKRGTYHAELLQKLHPQYMFAGMMSPDEMHTMNMYDRGYYDPKRKKFLTRAQTGGIDSQELRSSKIMMFREETKNKKKELNEGNPLVKYTKHLNLERK